MPFIPPRRKLAYPAGATPSFNSSHPAAAGCILSAVPDGGTNYINLRTGVPCVTIAGTTVPTFSITSGLGPGVSAATSTDKAPGVSFSVSGGTNFTLAAIFTCGVAGAYHPFVMADNFNVSPTLFIRGTDNNFCLYSGAASITSGIVPVPGRTYFGVASASTMFPYPCNFVLLDLGSGQCFQSFQITNRGSTAETFSTVSMLNDGQGDFVSAPVAAGMLSQTFLSGPQLLAWAKDPWAFWYPSKTSNLVNSAGAAATFLAAWARGSNLPVIGTGNY